MARHHAAILTEIWSDADFLALTPTAQRLYLFLLSQPQTSLVGHLDILPHRWARKAAGTTIETIMTDLLELEAARFVVVDHDEQELLIRTFVRHDMAPSRFSRALATGLWTSWRGISSAELRCAAVHAMPDFVWDKFTEIIPTEATRMRRSPPLEREQSPPLERTDYSPQEWRRLFPQERERPSPQEWPPSSLLPPPPPPSSSSEPRAIDTPSYPQDDDQRTDQARIETALGILAGRDLDARQTTPNLAPVGDVVSWTRKALGKRRRRHGAELANLAAQRPDASPAELAEAIDPLPLEAPSAMDAYAEQRAAARRRAQAGTAQVREVLHEPAPPPEVLANGARAAREALQQPRPERT